MEENKILTPEEELIPSTEEIADPAADLIVPEEELPVEETAAPAEESAEEENVPLDKNVRLMSPTRMVVRRFFRSRLSIIGLIMVVSLFLFSFVGPLIYTRWGEIELDESGKVEYATSETTYTVDGHNPGRDSPPWPQEFYYF